MLLCKTASCKVCKRPLLSGDFVFARVEDPVDFIHSNCMDAEDSPAVVQVKVVCRIAELQNPEALARFTRACMRFGAILQKYGKSVEEYTSQAAKQLRNTEVN